MFNPLLTGFQCVVCGALYSPETIKYTCPACGLIGVLDACYDFEQLTDRTSGSTPLIDREMLATCSDRTMWRYLQLLPLAVDTPRPGLPVGGTPLINAPRLARAIEVERLWIKDDGRNPTGS